MKRILATLFLAALSLTALKAQSTVVCGAVLDSLTRQGEPAAVIQFFKAPDTEKPVAFTTTDMDGKFCQLLPSMGEYTLLFTGVGRRDRRITFSLNGEEDHGLGEILIQDDVQSLKSASVTAQRPLVKMDVDRMTYNVADDVDSKTATVLEMLRKVPMVTVDGQDNITVNGSSSFQVTVDGKPSQMFSGNPSQIFKMMPASSIKDIQVITNPGVRYDAEGVGGVLNLVTNREATGGQSAADGFYGTVRAMGSTRGGGGGLFLSQQSGKFTWSLNGNGMYMKMPGTTTDVTREMLPAGSVTKTHSESAMTLPMGMGNLSAIARSPAEAVPDARPAAPAVPAARLTAASVPAAETVPAAEATVVPAARLAAAAESVPAAEAVAVPAARLAAESVPAGDPGSGTGAYAVAASSMISTRFSAVPSGKHAPSLSASSLTPSGPGPRPSRRDWYFSTVPLP